MKLSDYVVRFLAETGIDTIFGVTGGGIVHFFDSASRQGLKNVFTHHEQAAAFAAQAYARIRGLGASFFTTGPGGTNMVTGVAAAWVDSIPTFYIGGQVRRNQIKPPELRQQGTQELDVKGVFSPLVKYATTLMDPNQIKYELQKCLYMALSGRPGPVYLEIPLDLHWAQVDEKSMLDYHPEKKETLLPVISDEEMDLLLDRLYSAKAPLLVLGGGIRLAKAERELEEVLKALKIPYVTTWTAADLVDGADPLNLGHPGMFGSREANLAVQSADFLCCLGTHLSISVTTANVENFAKNAEIAVVNVDSNELKYQRSKVKYRIHSDVKAFLQKAREKIKSPVKVEFWIKKCVDLKKRFTRKPGQSSSPIDTYSALLQIAEVLMPDDTIVVDGGGTIVQIASQIFKVKKGQRFIIDSGLCAMGSGLPQSIGVSFAKEKGNVICLCGDGSFQFNVQELQTIFHHQLPVKLFIFNNEGYLSIRHTQEGFLKSHFSGSCAEGGLSVPNIVAVAAAYQIPAIQIKANGELVNSIERVLKIKGPAVCEILVSSKQEINPRIGFDPKPNGLFASRGMEDMHPYLPPQELAKIMSLSEE